MMAKNQADKSSNLSKRDKMKQNNYQLMYKIKIQFINHINLKRKLNHENWNN